MADQKNTSNTGGNASSTNRDLDSSSQGDGQSSSGGMSGSSGNGGAQKGGSSSGTQGENPGGVKSPGPGGESSRQGSQRGSLGGFWMSGRARGLEGDTKHCSVVCAG